mgnify:CR=1 FL=1
MLVLDEADKLLNMDFEKELDLILGACPKERNTFLFSATMTSKVEKLQRASLTNPVKVEVSSKYQTVKTLVQQYLFIPSKYKDCYLAFVLNEFAGQSAIMFVSTCATAQRVTLMLRSLGFTFVETDWVLPPNLSTSVARAARSPGGGAGCCGACCASSATATISRK